MTPVLLWHYLPILLTFIKLRILSFWNTPGLERLLFVLCDATKARYLYITHALPFASTGLLLGKSNTGGHCKAALLEMTYCYPVGNISYVWPVNCMESRVRLKKLIVLRQVEILNAFYATLKPATFPYS